MLGRSVEQDKAKAVEWLRKAVAQGEYRAMFWLGMAYEHGDGVAKDDWRAFDLWKQSHDIGWDPATAKLHSLFDEYRKDAERGNASAQFFLGVAHEYGYVGKPDAAKMKPLCFDTCQHVYRLMGETVEKAFSCGKALKG